MYIYIYIEREIYIHIHIYIYIYIHTHIHTYIHTYMHVHVYTHIPRGHRSYGHLSLPPSTAKIYTYTPINLITFNHFNLEYITQLRFTHIHQFILVILI